MSKHQLGWNRSYRQALERIARDGDDVRYRNDNPIDIDVAAGRIRLIADLWQCRGVAEVLADLDMLRQDEVASK